MRRFDLRQLLRSTLSLLKARGPRRTPGRPEKIEALESRTLLAASLVKDINPGVGHSSPSYLVNVGGTVFFSAYDATNGRELWKSDGTSNGTVIVTNIRPSWGSSDPKELANVNGTLFFAASDTTNGVELWKSDGSSQGTVMVRNIRPGS
jgi:ELWxxDGT repeat protein